MQLHLWKVIPVSVPGLIPKVNILTITEPMKDSPAEAAGLKAGDQIIAIDGVDMTGTLAELARQKVLGPADTQVVLTILREGVEQPFDVTVTRAQISIPSTEYKMLDNQYRLYTLECVQ